MLGMLLQLLLNSSRHHLCPWPNKLNYMLWLGPAFLAKGKTANIYAHSRYTSVVAHDFGKNAAFKETHNHTFVMRCSPKL